MKAIENNEKSWKSLPFGIWHKLKKTGMSEATNYLMRVPSGWVLAIAKSDVGLSKALNDGYNVTFIPENNGSK